MPPHARSVADELEAHRRALTAHCYRMLGTLSDADDAVQETMIRAWRHIDGFEGRGELRSWLYRIATRVCIDALQSRKRRALPMDLSGPGSPEGPLGEAEPSLWIDPAPDALLADERLARRDAMRLAFVSALQRLPARQRAALLLREVAGLTAAETAEVLETSVPAVNSALQRARAAIEAPSVDADAAPVGDLVDRYVDAFERYDMTALTALVREDVALCMPPYPLWVRGPRDVAAFMLGPGAHCRNSRLVPVGANGAPAFGQYHRDAEGWHPWSLVVLDLRGGRIATIHHFLDTERLFPRFGLAMRLPA